MKIKVLPVGMVQANCCILSTQANNAIVLDPGGDHQKIVDYLKQNGLTLKMILLTHGHFDHLAAVWELLDYADAPLCMHKADGEMIEDIHLALCNMGRLFFKYRENTPYQALSDGDQLTLDELTIAVIHTPGHSKGSSCYLINGSLFTGDTLFAGEVGRTDLYGGSYPQLKESLQKLADLPGDYPVYAGHGAGTSLEQERKKNPYMGQVDYDDYF